MAMSALSLFSCSGASMPEGKVEESVVSPKINPDYTDLVIPPNIAPLNFCIEMPGEEFIARISGNGAEILAGGNTVVWDEKEWRELLGNNRGKELCLEIFVRDNAGDWTGYKTGLKVSHEEIDPYFSYRLIEPSFVQYNQLSLNQRNLTNFETEIIFNNALTADEGRMSCINCHVPRNQYSDGKTQFHVRQANGGTLIMDGDRVKRVDLRTDSTKVAGVYQAWHPTLDLIAYSTNGTKQYFFTRDRQKVEVLDEWSDILLYDEKEETVEYVANDSTLLETFPAWSPDGKTLYYSVARHPDATDGLADRHREIKYDIVALGFDPVARKFSEKTDTVMKASEMGKSASLARISPDGRRMMTCVGDFGTFHIWHKSSDLWLTDLATGESRRLANANSEEADSYHSWSSNSRWVIFSSRRDDGSYTRPYIAYIDEDGNDSKAFVVPQENPEYYARLMKSFNVPEFMVSPVKFSRGDVLKAIEGEAVGVKFRGAGQ